MNTTSFLNLAEKLLADLNDRSREIVKKRFGLSSEQGETLEKIGQQYGITRERIRQIISEALKSVSEKAKHVDFIAAEEHIIFTIEKNGGIIKQTEIVEKFNLSDSSKFKEANAVRFFADCSKRIFSIEEKSVLEKAWVISKDIKQEILQVIKEAEKIIEGKKKSLTDQEMLEVLLAAIPELSSEKATNLLGASARIKKNKFGKWGMSGWMEINPKGTREKVHLILKEHKKPLHFTQIAALIDKFELGKKKAHPQTVHNELIKDERFVLIGRGIYVLREWGYSEGTIRDVIENILREAGKPMKKEEIVTAVLKVRKVKQTTIMINLNNRKFFEKKGDLYSIKK